MDVIPNFLTRSPTGSSRDELAELLGPGIVSLGAGGAVRFADERALELLGCSDGFELERLWKELGPRLEQAGLSWNGAGGTVHWAVLDLPVPGEPDPAGGAVAVAAAVADPGASPRRLVFDLRRDPEGGGVLLVQDSGTLTGLETDLRLTSQMRSVAQISPAVAHDLRAPINAMVFNIEILKEMIASGRAADPNNREKLLKYTTVLKEELGRLHKGLEIFLSFISPRSDKYEPLDLRELAEELAALLVAPARKQQVQVKPELPDGPVPSEGNRYLLRQALLHLSLATLAGVPKQGTLHVHLEHDGDLGHRARLRVYGMAGADSPAEPPPAEAPVPGFDLRVSPAGSLAQLWVARSILAAHGGEVRAADPAGAASGAPAGGPRAYEVELTILGNPGTEKKE